jgi:hypothetical protein
VFSKSFSANGREADYTVSTSLGYRLRIYQLLI